MNRFKVKLGEEKHFEDIWRNRDTHLNQVPGFKKFNLVKGEKTDRYLSEMQATHFLVHMAQDCDHVQLPQTIEYTAMGKRISLRLWSARVTLKGRTIKGKRHSGPGGATIYKQAKVQFMLPQGGYEML